MARVDMHLHSKHSLDGDEWFLKQFGARESYTEIEEVYALAKMNGMDFVTLTDHNTIDGALELVENHPYDTFTGVETTAFFPENGCKVHLLIYDLNEKQFEQIQSLRKSIYLLRDYLKSQDLACSVAHATFAVNGRLSMEVLEKLILLFDIFEGINGSRSAVHNVTWTKVLESLREEDTQALYEKYKIEPWSRDPWIKGFTGGSDDHAGALVGQTFTFNKGRTRQEFLYALKNKYSLAAGRSNNFKAMAFVFSKIANDISRGGKPSGDAVSDLFRATASKEGKVSLRTRFFGFFLERSPDPRQRIFGEFIQSTARGLECEKAMTIDEKMDLIYGNLAKLYDAFLKTVAEGLAHDMKSGRAVQMFARFFNSIPAALIAAPFLGTLKLLHQNQNLIDDLCRKFIRDPDFFGEASVLYFTDNVRCASEIPAAIRRMKRKFSNKGTICRLVTCLEPEEVEEITGNAVINLPAIAAPELPFFQKETALRIPSLLRSLDAVQDLNSSRVVVETAGPVGFMGLLAARLLDVPCTGLLLQTPEAAARGFLKTDEVDPDAVTLFENYIRWFFNLMDETVFNLPSRSRLKVQEQGVVWTVADPEAAHCG